MNVTEVNQEELCTQSLNFSCFGRASLTAVDVLMYLSAAAVVLLTVCGNLLVIISICHFKQLHTPTNLLLLSLAVADLLVGLLVMPFYFIMLIESHWCFGEIYCTLYNVFSFHLTCVSIYNIAFIALDRYLALHNPFLYSTQMTVNLTLKIISVLWLYSVIYNLILLYFNGHIIEITENTTCDGDCFVGVNEIWAVVDFVIVFIFPCLTMIIMYLKIFAVAKYHANTIRCITKQQHSKKTKKMNSLASERKAAKTLGILVSVFLLCLVPYYISTFLDVYIRKPSVSIAVLIMMSLLALNSSFNPILYALFYPWFQKCVHLIVTLKICYSESSLINVHSKHT